LHHSHGEYRGVRIARKHIGWYLKGRPDALETRQKLMRCGNAKDQFDLLREYFLRLEHFSGAKKDADRLAA